MTDSNQLTHFKRIARSEVSRLADQLVGLSHRIHAAPELGFEEYKAVDWLTTALAELGFHVTTPLCDLSTAFQTTIGSGPLHVAFIAEYDALPGIGHACGHNIIAASSLGAAASLRGIADDAGLTISVVGTPAEEGGGGKIILLDRGAFDTIHVAMMVHPAAYDALLPKMIAAQPLEISYSGRASHASAYPEEGLNAADALTLAQVAVGLLRQHMNEGDRVHGIVTHGGDAPQVIPAHTSASYLVRSMDLEGLKRLHPRVVQCFEAGATGTGTRLGMTERPPYAEMRHHPALARLYNNNATSLGRVFDAPRWIEERATGSTDMGNVSRARAAIHPWIGINSLPAVNHQPEFAAACATGSADAALLDASVSLAWTALDAALDRRLRDQLMGVHTP
jgi:amidohydrolase